MTLTSVSALGNPCGSESELELLETVSISERNDIGAVLISISGHVSESLPRLEEVLNCELPTEHGCAPLAGGKRALWLNPHSWIIMFDSAEEFELVDAVAEAFPDHTVHATRFTDALCWLALDSDAEELLLQGSFISLDGNGLPVGNAKRTPIGGVPAMVLSGD